MKDSEFEQMAVRLRRKAMKASLAYGIGPMASEDIAQDVMLKLWVMRDELCKYSSVDALAVIMARRLSLNKLRDERMVDIGRDAEVSVSTARSPQEA